MILSFSESLLSIEVAVIQGKNGHIVEQQDRQLQCSLYRENKVKQNVENNFFDTEDNHPKDANSALYASDTSHKRCWQR